MGLDEAQDLTPVCLEECLECACYISLWCCLLFTHPAALSTNSLSALTPPLPPSSLSLHPSIPTSSIHQTTRCQSTCVSIYCRSTHYSIHLSWFFHVAVIRYPGKSYCKRGVRLVHHCGDSRMGLETASQEQGINACMFVLSSFCLYLESPGLPSPEGRSSHLSSCNQDSPFPHAYRPTLSRL